MCFVWMDIFFIIWQFVKTKLLGILEINLHVSIHSTMTVRSANCSEVKCKWRNLVFQILLAMHYNFDNNLLVFIDFTSVLITSSVFGKYLLIQ